MSLVLAFLLATHQAKTLTFDRAFDFQIKLAVVKRTKVDCFDKARILFIYLIENKLEDEKDQCLTFEDDGDRLKLLRMDMNISRSSIFELVRFHWKLKFQEKEGESFRIDEIGEFQIDETL